MKGILKVLPLHSSLPKSQPTLLQKVVIFDVGNIFINPGLHSKSHEVSANREQLGGACALPTVALHWNTI